ncbi:bifunctional folylpolyglutamate synthase/dihydrofolate synthase [Aerococcaceae bacterium zg-ZUI334]|uniref:bifunctional folylpolyglutamate synthase/dihydrofolate synthase n=1 Tax=Aerococcaceae bacterium zg-252 TaxID=2796928 RepID=UPI001B8F3769|nr:bifunctional folylpolyglutamate synthase/dihydrofolate synthase [Aerococcaceae bacterium zg-ZUI334]
MATQFSTIEEILAWLHGQKNPIHREGLDKIKTALAFLGNPQQNLKTIHISGTNGKGSVTAYLKQLFLAHGMSVGAFTSPHIMRFNERITFNHEEISDETLMRLMSQVALMNDYMEQTEYGRLVYFELYTVLMFLYFQEQQPDICLIEVGIGGLLDCTNVIESSDVVITTVGLDHIDKLGSTYAEIATQKAGIIYPHSDVYVGELPESALLAVEFVCHEKGATLHHLPKEQPYQLVSESLVEGTTFQIADNLYTIHLLGRHQVHNAALARMVFVNWMQKNRQMLDETKVRDALAATKWLARMEKMSDNPLIYIDGAHNEAGIKALIQVIQTHFENQSVSILYAGLQTKNQVEHLALLQSMPLEQLVLTTFDHYQAMTEVQFAEICQDSNVPIRFESDWYSVLQNQKDTIWIVTGSLYFVSEVRQKFIR